MTEDQPQPQCPDGIDCDHRCLSGCWRVLHDTPWTGTYAGDAWPTNVRRAMGAVVQDGAPIASAAIHWGSQQGRILAFLHAHLAEHGYPPSIREVGDAVGLTSVSSVAHQLKVLEARGHISRVPGTPRAITLLTGPPPTEKP